MADEPLGGRHEGVRPSTLKVAAIGGVAVGGAFVLLSVLTKKTSGSSNATSLPGGSNASTGEPGSNLDAAQSGVSGSSTAPSYISEYINEGNTTTTTTGGASSGGAAAQSYGAFGTVDPLGSYWDAQGVYHSPLHSGGTSPDNRGTITANGTETIGQYAQSIGQDWRDLYINNNSRLYNAGVDWQNLSASTVLPANVSLVY